MKENPKDRDKEVPDVSGGNQPTPFGNCTIPDWPAPDDDFPIAPGSPLGPTFPWTDPAQQT